ncbi:FAD-containing monooxygenase EthA [Burkholderia singularis]|uniref:FAD-containing monooxygenase EthA n=1 Tax=Burkholderia singularis TaxID=1503053 RepID=A0A118DPW6_9BURK|nr:NAD(P)/FAD-dependent oxidoreductase [Burkholderia singularis]KVE28853.1 FAD-containing monooxygenase EthA [Burkholderia singularis]
MNSTTDWHTTLGPADERAPLAATGAAPRAADYDVLIVGAGISGIGAAYYLRERCPGAKYAILEGRSTMGGTWDLFRYPGVRSDSDMFTLGFSFRPWQSDNSIAHGQSILDYIKETAREFGIDKAIRFNHKVTAASWDSSSARWTVRVQRTDGERVDEAVFTCRILYMCSGYYDYEAGHAPSWPDQETYQGRIVHPQHWPSDLDYAGKRVVVIGSGATAVTLVPSMTPVARHVTMLQRSPTYIMSLPARDPVAGVLRRWLPAGLAHRVVRVKNVLLTMYFYNLSRRRPNAIKKLLIHLASRQSGPQLDAGKHLTPRYKPWDQRLCLVPNGDLFKAIRAGNASIVTDEIERFTPTGLLLKSGERLDADVVVTATGLKLKMLGGISLTIDGQPVDLSQTVSYKGMMFSGVPNLVLSFGYTNASWTLKAELIAQYVCRMFQHMRTHGYDVCVPRLPAGQTELEPFVDLSSGYIQRAAAMLPKQGVKKPWKAYQNYIRDFALFRFGSLADGALRFESRRPTLVEQNNSTRQPAYEGR